MTFEWTQQKYFYKFVLIECYKQLLTRLVILFYTLYVSNKMIIDLYANFCLFSLYYKLLYFDVKVYPNTRNWSIVLQLDDLSSTEI